ncbi:glycosyltransferase family 39 protein [Caldilinea sp.]|uniref:glycosyltransferase family 39 protein n=1 Tax=Caldilinea sp. TaxID=2293560 RepID=UPI00262595CD|nr:glycosyltransferase family 39 protein [uncultured Caldilinea sp.]
MTAAFMAGAHTKTTAIVSLSSHRARLLAAILIAFGLTTFRLDFQSLWYDEGVTAFLARQGPLALTQWTAGDIQPPLYYYIAAGWGALAGWSEWSLRFPSAWWVTLTTALMAALTLRLSASRSAAALAALLTALHPLLIYYGQEARMYAQLTALGVLAGYLLVRLATASASSLYGWIAFVLVGAAAVYTHYFAVFLLVGLALAFTVDVLVRETRRPAVKKLRALALAGAAILLLYAPWLGALFGQLRNDRSYWEGALKLQEAIAKVAVAFTSGETVFEQTALWLLGGYAALTAIAVGRLWRRVDQGRRLLLYAGCWLLTPVIAVLTLAMTIPKFNARYVMEALPGLLLIWAGGFSLSGNTPAWTPWSTLRRASTLLLLLGFVYGAAGWFFNPAFSKDQWRQLAEFLRPRLAEDETVLLVSGHAWPVWEYYAPDLPVVRLPALDILDVDAVLDFPTTGAALRRAFAEGSGLRGAWLVTWQAEVVDPNDVVPVQLELSGREKGQSATFHGLGLRRFTGFREHRFVVEPPIDVAVDLVFGNQVLLRGYKAMDNGDLLLFWERLLPAGEPAPDLHMTLATTTAAGVPVATTPERRLAGYTYPFARWRSGEIVMSHVPARTWLGAAEPTPGAYRFTLRVFDMNDPTASPLPLADGRTEVELGPVEVTIE